MTTQTVLTHHLPAHLSLPFSVQEQTSFALSSTIRVFVYPTNNRKSTNRSIVARVTAQGAYLIRQRTLAVRRVLSLLTLPFISNSLLTSPIFAISISIIHQPRLHFP